MDFLLPILLGYPVHVDVVGPDADFISASAFDTCVVEFELVSPKGGLERSAPDELCEARVGRVKYELKDLLGREAVQGRSTA